MVVSDTWYSKIESSILTYLEYLLVGQQDAPFPDLTCTTSSENESVEGVAFFPTLYVHLLPSVEIGNDLTNITVNGIRATLELQVFSNKSEDDCLKIITRAIQELKKQYFSVNMFPDPQSTGKNYVAIARLSRVVAAGELDTGDE